MAPEDRNEAALLDMRLRSRRAVDRLGSRSLREFLADEDTQDIVIRCLEVIGEAAGRMSPEGQSLYPRVPWRQISGMRNRLIHDYGNVDLESVWLTVVEDLPALLQELG